MASAGMVNKQIFKLGDGWATATPIWLCYNVKLPESIDLIALKERLDKQKGVKFVDTSHHLHTLYIELDASISPQRAIRQALNDDSEHSNTHTR